MAHYGADIGSSASWRLTLKKWRFIMFYADILQAVLHLSYMHSRKSHLLSADPLWIHLIKYYSNYYNGQESSWGHIVVCTSCSQTTVRARTAPSWQSLYAKLGYRATYLWCSERCGCYENKGICACFSGSPRTDLCLCWFVLTFLCGSVSISCIGLVCLGKWAKMMRTK